MDATIYAQTKFGGLHRFENKWALQIYVADKGFESKGTIKELLDRVGLQRVSYKKARNRWTTNHL